MSDLSKDLPCISTLFVCDICGNGFISGSEATACYETHKKSDDVVVKTFPRGTEKEIVGKTSKKRKVSDNEEESADEMPKKARKSGLYMWPKEKMNKFLELVKFNKRRLLDRRIKKKVVFRDILEQLQLYDPYLTASQVEKKFKNMVQSYKKYCEFLKTGEVNSRVKKPECFEVINDLFLTKKNFTMEELYSQPIPLNEGRRLKMEPHMNTSSCLESTLNSENDADLNISSFLETRLHTDPDVDISGMNLSSWDKRLNSEMDLQEDDPPESTEEGKQKKGRPKRNRLSTISYPVESSDPVESSIQHLVDAAESAIRVDETRLKYLEAQANRQDRFDKDVLDAFKDRNSAIKKNSIVINEFKHMLRTHMQLVKDIDARTTKMEKFIETHFKID